MQAKAAVYVWHQNLCESRSPQEEVVVLLLDQELTKSPLTPDSFACCMGRRGRAQLGLRDRMGGPVFLLNSPSPFPCCSRDRGRCFHISFCDGTR